MKPDGGTSRYLQDQNSSPLWEHRFEEGRNPMSRPLLKWNGGPLPDRCLMSFMNDRLLDHVGSRDCEIADTIPSETCDYPVFIDERSSGPVCLVHAPVGGAACAIVADLLIASGVAIIMACGGCGVLSPIARGKLIVVEAALRDEGVSYHYLPPAREVVLSRDMVHIADETLAQLEIPHKSCRVWTSDGFFRETPSLIDLRKEQGYEAVDMECASLGAVAESYGCRFGEILYSGDSLEDSRNHDDRNWIADLPARSAAFAAALAVLDQCTGR